jgi:hypothetical protein
MSNRIKIDLRVLPIWLQYLIASVVAGVVMFIAWQVGRDEPQPEWLIRYIYPLWRYGGPALLLIFILIWAGKKLQKLRNSERNR